MKHIVIDLRRVSLKDEADLILFLTEKCWNFEIKD